MMDNRWSLQGMTALITGGTKGIGYEVVEELAGFGSRVHTCTRDGILMEECLREWQAKGFHVTGSVCGLSSWPERHKLMQNLSSLFGGKLNILVNNVAAAFSKPTVECTAEDFWLSMATSQLGHTLLKASGSGSIVFVSSVAGVVSLHSAFIYGATKEYTAAMNQLAKNLACEWGSDNIRANSVGRWLLGSSQPLRL
ncbi:PREDICTED: tropinone reductase homolog At1g07450-like [Tarenaya hassleriana]|uniref:tropinone reductase homolog At1g07450-like n=1 Tax=Tarenaya hassleriana TaxID=28532 RepID=UPI00053C648D|nr:PREDICTED: tropinone reductase homolog At1g07450-like [Tarenaya hassleriana]